jgi:hypothetical protein
MCTIAQRTRKTNLKKTQISKLGKTKEEYKNKHP